MGFVSWVGLRGGVSIFLATIPVLAGLPNAELYFNIAFVVVVVSLVVQGWSIGFAARRAGVALRDPAPEVQRIDIDLPGQLDEELVGYPLRDPSPATRHRALPSWVRPVLVVRDGKVLDPMMAGNLKPGDYGYFLAPTTRIPRLDRFFAVDGTALENDSIPELPFDATIGAGAVADLYGLTSRTPNAACRSRTFSRTGWTARHRKETASISARRSSSPTVSSRTACTLRDCCWRQLQRMRTRTPSNWRRELAVRARKEATKLRLRAKAAMRRTA